MTDRKKETKRKVQKLGYLENEKGFFLKIKALSFGKIYKNKGHKL